MNIKGSLMKPAFISLLFKFMLSQSGGILNDIQKDTAGIKNPCSIVYFYIYNL
ncbi:hypothetical protein [Cellulosilyticum sp. I15G10I2]|uniref:hypothetical protein n=1 Tax=Cellulosilyticum sp. I15G10I2 TaxID=1892843 RepID=UPI001496039E|nr:hypothetical protein [Cellulosilyticum sp. I15G10I2]